MSKITKAQENESSLDFHENEIREDDYVFVIRADGTLKTVMMPEENTFDTPDEIQRILSVYNMDLSELAEPRVLH